MKKMVWVGLLLCLGISSCQCSWKPDIGPVEEEEDASLLFYTPLDNDKWA